ncbi:MAG TPA: DUF2173 family protein [Gammaproteobacteria bacterium]|nr:DUF2173 family protein [Gammaproteobacteria bacterium]
MGKLDELMSLQGALAAFEFSDRGELREHRIADGAQLGADTLDLLCHVCVANMSIATMQARGWEKMTGAQGFYPIDGFTMVGFDWSAVASGNRGVVLRNEQADYEAAYAALADQGAS